MTTIPDEAMTDLLSNARLIASVGLTDDPGRPSYQVASYQQSQGYKVIPVNPSMKSVLGHKAASNLTEVDEPIDIVNVFTHGSQAPSIVEAAIQSGAKALWLQPGVNSPEAEQLAMAAGLTVISNRCFKTEHQRLVSGKPM